MHQLDIYIFVSLFINGLINKIENSEQSKLIIWVEIVSNSKNLHNHLILFILPFLNNSNRFIQIIEFDVNGYTDI